MTVATIREFAPADRYLYDFTACHYSKGWAQLDTRQDASYYGNWINPLTRQIFSYCEGDTTLVKCETDEEFIEEVRKAVEWHRQAGYFIGIDGMCNEPIIHAFMRLGFANLLH